MQWVLDDSLNDGAIGVQQLMGQNAFYDNLAAFGIGAPTGVDLAGEANYPLPPQNQWQAINYATASFGQGVMVTPLQMVTAINAVANGGVWVQPHVVNSITNPITAPGKQEECDPCQSKKEHPAHGGRARLTLMGRRTV